MAGALSERVVLTGRRRRRVAVGQPLRDARALSGADGGWALSHSHQGQGEPSLSGGRQDDSYGYFRLAPLKNCGLSQAKKAVLRRVWLVIIY